MTAPVLDHLAVLADPLRARLLAVLDGHELTVSELCDVLQLPQSTVSRHLKTLGDGGWVVSRRDGTSRFYSLAMDDEAAARLWDLVREQVSKTPAASQDERRLHGVLLVRRRKSEEFFSSTAGQWDRVREDLFGATSHLRPLLALVSPDWVIGDLGCGTGQVAAALAPFVHGVIAVDGSPEMLDAARTRLGHTHNVDLRRGALEQLPIDDGTLDAAVLALVLHHLPDPGAALAEAARVLKAGGRLVVADMLPHDRDEYRQAMGHVWLGFSEKQIEKLLRGAGFDAIRILSMPAEPQVKGPALFVASATRARHE